MTQQKGSTATVMIGYESTYGTEATTGFVLPVNSVDIKPNQNITSPNTLTGSRNPTSPILGRKDVGGSIVVPVDSIAFWYWLKCLLGDPVTTGTGPYVHEFKIGDTVPSFTLEQAYTDLATDAYVTHLGLKITTFSIGVGDDGELVANFGVMGAETELDTSAFDASPTTVSLARLQHNDAAIEEGGASLTNATNISNAMDNSLDGNTFVIGDGGVRGSINEGVVKASGSLDTLFEDVSLLTKAINSTETSLKLTITGSATSIVEFEIQELKYAMTAPAMPGPQGLMVNLSYEGFYDDGSEAAAFVARVTNSEAHA